jgi:hypothetical protein
VRGMATDGLAKLPHGSNVLDASRKCKILSRSVIVAFLTVGAASWSVRIRTALCEDLHAGAVYMYNYMTRHDTRR